MFIRHFSHEFRTAVYDTRRVAWIPGILAALTFLIWQAPWSGRPVLAAGVDNESCRTVAAFFDDQWVWVGWLIPWFMLRYPSLHDSDALWRSAPVGRWTVFGARLAWAFLATAIVPTVVAWCLCRRFFPIAAADQSVTVFWIQSVLFCVGAFAAFSFKGRRGLWVTGAMGLCWFVINLFGEDAAKWILHHWVLAYWKESDFNPVEFEYMGISRTWPGIISWVLIPVVIIFWIPFKIARPGRESRMWKWILAICGVALAAQGALFLTPYRTPSYPKTTLPAMKVEMKYRGQPWGSSIWLAGSNATLPEKDLRFIDDRSGGFTGDWRSADLLSGEWRCGELSGRFSPQLENSRMNMGTDWIVGEDGMIPDNRTYGFESYVRPLRETFGTPGVKVWVARNVERWSGFRDKDKPVYEWADSDTFMQKPRQVGFTLNIPKLKVKADGPEKLVIDPKVFAGKTIVITIKTRPYRALPPKIVCRFPFATGGVAIDVTGRTISILPGLPDDKGFLMRRVYRALPLAPRPKPTDGSYIPEPDHPEVMLYNAKQKQALFLMSDMRWNERREFITAPDDPDAEFGRYPYIQYSLPTHAPKLSPEWFAGAELVVLEYKDEPVTLPLELTLKVPAAKK